jgi:hypothetical protein
MVRHLPLSEKTQPLGPHQWEPPATRRLPAIRRISGTQMLPRLFVSRGTVTRYPCSFIENSRPRCGLLEQRRGPTHQIPTSPSCQLIRGLFCKFPAEMQNLWRPRREKTAPDMEALLSCGFDREVQRPKGSIETRLAGFDLAARCSNAPPTMRADIIGESLIGQCRRLHWMLSGTSRL